MIGFRLRREFHSQPRSPAGVNKGHPVARGLVELVLPVNGGNPTSLIDGTRWTTSQGVSAGSMGVGASVVVTQSAPTRASGLNLAAGADFTMLFVVSGLGYNGSNPGVWRDGSALNGGTFCIFNGSTGRPWIRVNGADVLKPVSGYQLPSGTNTAFAFRARSAAEAAFAADGVLRHTVTHATATVASSVWQIGIQNDATQMASGAYAMWAVWNRALSDAEMQLVTANPWVLFAPQTLYLGVPAATGGGGTFIPAWAVNTNSVLGSGIHVA